MIIQYEPHGRRFFSFIQLYEYRRDMNVCKKQERKKTYSDARREEFLVGPRLLILSRSQQGIILSLGWDTHGHSSVEIFTSFLS